MHQLLVMKHDTWIIFVVVFEISRTFANEIVGFVLFCFVFSENLDNSDLLNSTVLMYTKQLQRTKCTPLQLLVMKNDTHGSFLCW